MYKTFLSLDWKVLAAIGFIIFSLIAAYLFFSFNSALPTAKSTPRVSPISNSTIPAHAWQIYTDGEFSISYPPDVTTTTSTFSGGGKALIFDLPQGPNYSMTLEVVPSSTETNNIETIYSIFRGLYQETDINVNGISGKQFQGSHLLGDKNIQEKAVIVENQGQIYKLHLLYYSNERNTQVDNLFSQILSTLYFK